MRKTNYWLIYLILGSVFLSVSCSKISLLTQKDYSGHYILGAGETPITIQRLPDKTIWINFYGDFSTQANVKGNRLIYTMGQNTAALIFEKDGKTLNSEHDGKVIANIGEIIEDQNLWNAFQSFTRSNFAEAETGFRQYLQSHPDDLWVQLTLTKALIQQGKITDAKSEMAKFENNPELKTNSTVKAIILVLTYTLTGKEKSAQGQNAWDGYEEVLKLATAVPQGLPQDIYTRVYEMERHPKPLGQEERNIIQQYIAPNMDAIQKFLSLPEKQECFITSASRPASDQVIDMLRAQSLVKSIVLYSRLRAEEGRVKESVEAYRRIIRFGQQMNNGPVIPQMTGVAIQHLGEMGFGLLFTEGKITQQEDAQFIYNILKELIHSQPVITPESISQFHSGQEDKDKLVSIGLLRGHNVETKLILLETSSAVKLYQLKEGKTLESLQRLVPDYLSESPVDTFSKNPIIYNPQDLKLYSFGPDSTNDNGFIQYDPTNGTFSNGDIIFP